MRVNLARATGLTAVLLSALAFTAAPAAAGGPTSALLSVPGAGTTASLYYTDPEYDELAGLVGMSEPGGTFDGQQGAGLESGAGVTVTWMIHDVEPWRVDRIYLGADGGPWISTQVSNGDSLWESPVLWHQPENGKQLTALLDGLGLGNGASKDTSFDGVAGAPPESAPATTPPAATPAPEEPAGSSWARGIGWAFAGLMGGVLLTFTWTRRRPSPEEPAPQRTGDGLAEVLAR
jgi:hypothetical protein